MKGFRIFILAVFSILMMNTAAIAQKRGAEDTRELSKVLFEAIRMNNFQALTNYIPDDHELDSLRVNAHEANKPLFENTNAEVVESAVLHGFDEIIRTGITENINWSNVELTDYKTRTCSIVLIGCNVSFTIQDMSENRIRVAYDAIKIGERWFIFQNLTVISSTQ